MIDCCDEIIDILDISSFNTSNVEDMEGMFANTGRMKELRINLSDNGFNTSKVKNMSFMFYCCGGARYLSEHDFDMSNVIFKEDIFLMDC